MTLSRRYLTFKRSETLRYFFYPDPMPGHEDLSLISMFTAAGYFTLPYLSLPYLKVRYFSPLLNQRERDDWTYWEFIVLQRICIIQSQPSFGTR